MYIFSIINNYLDFMLELYALISMVFR